MAKDDTIGSVEQIKAQIAALKDLNAVYEQVRTRNEEIAELTGKSVDEAKILQTVYSAASAVLKKNAELLTMSKNAAREKVIALREEMAQLSANGDLTAEGTQDLLQQIELYEGLTTKSGAVYDNLVATTAKTKEQIAGLAHTLETTNELVKAQGDYNTALGKSVSSFGKMFGVSAKVSDSLIASALKLKLEGGSFMDTPFLNQFRDAETKALSFTKVLSSLFFTVLASGIETFKKLGFEIDKLSSDFQKATQAGSEHNDVFRDISESMIEHGLSLENAKEAMTSLYDGMSEFRDLTQQEQIELGKFTGTLNAAGIGAGTTTKSMELLTKTLHMNEKEAQRVVKGLLGTAAALDISKKKMMETFAAVEDSLSQHGAKMIEVFKNLQGQAIATGISVQGLIGIASKFDTFEGAADSVSKLNSILGGPYLNSVEMVYATEEERISSLKASVEASGKAWESLNRFEKMAIANAAGITKMSEANKLFGASLEEVDSKMKAANEALALTDEALQEMATAARPLLDLLKAMLASVIAPLIRDFTTLLGWLKEGAQWFFNLGSAADEATGGALQASAGRIFGYGLLITMLFSKLKALGFGFTLFASGTTAAGTAATASQGIFSKVASGITSVGKGIINFFGSMTSTVINIIKGLASTVINIVVKLASSIASVITSVGQAIAGFATGVATAIRVLLVGLGQGIAGFVSALAAVAPMAGPAALVLGVLVLGALGLAGALKLAEGPMQVMVSGFSVLMSTLTNENFVPSLVSLTVAIGAFATLGVPAAVAATALAAGLALLMLSMKLLNAEKVDSLTNMFSSLENTAVSNILSITNAIREMVGLLDDVELDNVIQIQTFYEAVGKIPNNTATLKASANMMGEINKSTPEVMTAAKEYILSLAQVSNNSEVVNKVSELTAAIKSAVSKKEETSSNKELVLKLDGREFGRTVLDILDKENSLAIGV